MSKKKVKATKTKKKQQENRYFFGALLTVGALLVVGIAASVLFGSGPAATTGAGGAGNDVLSQMNSEYGDKWRGLGFTNWTYDGQMTMMFFDSAAWGNLPRDEMKKRIETAGKDVEQLVKKNGGDPKDVYIMIHDEKDRMPATYSSSAGAEFSN